MNLLAAEFEGDRGRAGAVQDRWPADPPARSTRRCGKLPKGQVTIGIRPRALIPNPAGSADTIAGQAELIEPMGAETLIHARTPLGNDLRVVVPREIKMRVRRDAPPQHGRP